MIQSFLNILEYSILQLRLISNSSVYIHMFSYDMCIAGNKRFVLFTSLIKFLISKSSGLPLTSFNFWVAPDTFFSYINHLLLPSWLGTLNLESHSCLAHE